MQHLSAAHYLTLPIPGFILNLMKPNRNPYRISVPGFIALTGVLSIILISCTAVNPVEKQLKKLNLEYRRDSEGDYRVQIPIPGEKEVQVGISAHAHMREGEVKIRDIWSVAGRIPGELPEGLAEDLLGDSWSSRDFGSWALAGTTSAGKQVLVYLVRIPESSSPEILYEALMDAAESAQGLHSALAPLEGD
jgi:HAMP domain-containing protein